LTEFEQLVRKNSEMVRAFLLSSVRDPALVEDLFQETFINAWRSFDRYRRDLPFGPWVRGIAAKLVMKHRRRLGRSRVFFCDAEALGYLEESFRQFDQLHGDTFEEKLDALRVCLGRLSGAQKEAVTLHYQLGLSCRKIAERIGLGYEAVKKHLQRGRAALFDCIQARIGEAVRTA
jgi:RNA polymerase sigma-70 factor